MAKSPIREKGSRLPLIDLCNRTIRDLWKRLQPLTKLGKEIFSPAVLFVLILLLGIYARVWEFGQLPPGLNQDEASIGVEAYSLLHFGVDRNGISYPVNFISWGNGMDALYGYLLIPFMAFGLTPFTVRLPILLSGILTIPLIYFIAKRCLGKKFALLSMFLLAISPWHILMSRWGINENILPFFFAVGFVCLLLSTSENVWFVVSMAFFGLCLYAYGAMYIAVPVFLVCAIPVLWFSKRVSRRNLIIGLLVFVILIVPIGLFILVNAFGLDTIRIGVFTIPRLPVQARFLGMAATSHVNPLGTIVNNARGLIKLLLIYQSDGYIWNTVEPFGYLYVFSFPLAVLGAVLLLPSRQSKHIPERLLLLSWLLAAICIGLFQYVNINRIHLIFLPLILCTAVFLSWLGDQKKTALAILIVIYLVSFIAFNNVYHSASYRQDADDAFFAGLIPALDYARKEGDGPICVTDNVNMPYIFVLFIERMNPSQYINEMRFVDPDNRVGKVRSLGRYTFGMANCHNDQNTIYVLKDEEPPNRNGYSAADFAGFHVYSPINQSP